MRVIVTGVPGVGKSTVMEAAAKAKHLKIVNYGSVMFETAKAQGLVKHRDELRRLPAEQQRKIQADAAENIRELGDVIVDTHATIRTPAGYLPGLPAWVLDKLQPHVIVLVEATPEEIHRRRTADGSRTRDPDVVSGITEHQAMNRSIAMAYAALTVAAVKIVENHDGSLEHAVATMVEGL